VLYYCGAVWGLFGWSSGSQLEAREAMEALDVVNDLPFQITNSP
jgi:hypothetical protein